MVQKSEAVENFEGYAEHDGDKRCQNHALYADGAEGKFCAGQADNHDNGGHNKVRGFAVINLAGTGMLWMSSDSLPMKLSRMANTAAPPITHTL